MTTDLKEQPQAVEPEAGVPAPRDPERCVIVVDAALPPGKAANAAAVVAFTLGQRHGHLVGGPLVARGGEVSPGFIHIGIPVLRATAEQLAGLRQKSQALLEQGDVVNFPAQGQQTTDYQAFLDAVWAVPGDTLQPLALGLVGPRKKVGKLVGGFALLA